MVEIRHARAADVPGICQLVNQYAELGRMLHRSMESVYDALREFCVAVDESGVIVGCVALDVFWADLGEIKSLAVSPQRRGQGLGSRLLQAALEDARLLGITKVFALTYEKEFFSANGFEVIDRGTLPEKVWRECIACPKADACDEIAMIRQLAEKSENSKLETRK